MLMQSTPHRVSTRDRLLEVAEAAVLAKGFASTSIDELIAATGITKSGFFYHFRDKNALAKALLLRYLEQDAALLESVFSRGDALHDDPLHAFLIGLKLFAEMLENIPDNHPGCLAAAYCYQDQLFSQEIRELNAAGMLAWRTRFLERLRIIAERYPPRAPVDLTALADMITTIVEGGIILSKALRDAQILPAQILLYRDYLRLLFDPRAAG